MTPRAPGPPAGSAPSLLPLALAAFFLLPAPALAQSSNDTVTASTATFVTSLVFNVVVASVEIAAFLLLRPRFAKIYQPKSYLPPSSRRQAPLPKSIFGWIPAFINAPATDIIAKNGLDAYVFLDFLDLMLRIFVPVWLVSWVVLFPVDAVRPTNNLSGLDLFTFGNVNKAKRQQARYAAHLILVYFFVFWMLYNIKVKMSRWVRLRQEYLLSPAHARTAQARSVLFTGVPKDMLSVPKLTAMFSNLPGGVCKIWLNRDLKEIPDIFDDRQKAVGKLEAAENKLIKLAHKLVKKGKAQRPSDAQANLEKNAGLVDQVVPKKERPTHRLGKIPCMGQKVDTIDWAREEVPRLNALLDEKRAQLATDVKEYPPQNSVFILFNTQIAAHLAARSLAHHKPYHMAGHYIEIAPDDVIWGNLNMNPYEQKLRSTAGLAASIALVCFWAIPVAFVGLVSNVKTLCSTAPWLAWLCSTPAVVSGIISGVLPPVAFAVLNMLVPIILRLFARFGGIPTYNGLELALMHRFYFHQVLNGFLILTLASGFTTLAKQLKDNPTQAATLLAGNLPRASIYFLTFLLLQGLSGTAGGLLQIGPLVVYYVKKFLLGSTPRSVWHIEHDMGSVAWGTLFPTVTLLTMIGIGYMIIAPVVNGFCVATFGLFYILYKYLFLYVYDMPPSKETGGRFFPKAIQHIFVALYVMEVCLAALFFLAQDSTGSQSAVAEGALTVVLIVLTIGFQVVLNNSYDDLLDYLPLSLVAPQLDAVVADAPADADGDADYKKGQGAAATATFSTTSPSTSPRGAALSLHSTYDNRQSLDPLVAAAARADPERRHGRVDKAATSGGKGQDDVDDKAFDHPAAKKPQTPVWMPDDYLGIGRTEDAANRARQIASTTEGARLTEKGELVVDAEVPPGEELA